METEEGRLNAYLCYYDHDVEKADPAFKNSEEWGRNKKITCSLPGSYNRVLDLGSGNGIASYAFIKSGYSVVSMEPDESDLTGYGAMKNYKKSNDFPFCKCKWNR